MEVDTSVSGVRWSSNRIARPCTHCTNVNTDPVEPDTFWINPYGVHFGMLKVSDMVRVDEEGNRVGGGHGDVNTAGFIIHSQIHKARPDINAACHMHSPYGRAWSTFGKPIEMLNQGQFHRPPVS